VTVERLISVVGVVVAVAAIANTGLSLWLVSRDAEQARNIHMISERAGRLEEWKASESSFRSYVSERLAGDISRTATDVSALRDLVGRACGRP
jgi:hypothetical protein